MNHQRQQPTGTQSTAGYYGLLSAILLLLLLSPADLIYGQGSQLTTYSGLWETGGGQKLWVDTDWNSLLGKREEFRKEGFRIVDIETIIIGGRRRYSAVWTKSDLTHRLRKTDDWTDFRQWWNSDKQEGFRLIDVEVYSEGGVRKLLGIWHQGTYQHKLIADAGWEDFFRKYTELKAQGFLLVDIETYVHQGRREYAAIWRSGEGEVKLYHDMVFDQFRSRNTEMKSAGMRLVDFESYRDNTSQSFKYIGIWTSGNREQSFRDRLSAEKYLLTYQQQKDGGKKLIDLELGFTQPQPKLDEDDYRNVVAEKAIGKESVEEIAKGRASFYDDRLHGNLTASGEPYNRDDFTAAHPNLPFGTRLLVTNLVNQRTVIVRINDRGPFAKNRILDLSYAAAEKIGAIQFGVVEVKLEIIKD